MCFDFGENFLKEIEKDQALSLFLWHFYIRREKKELHVELNDHKNMIGK